MITIIAVYGVNDCFETSIEILEKTSTTYEVKRRVVREKNDEVEKYDASTRKDKNKRLIQFYKDHTYGMTNSYFENKVIIIGT